MQAWPLERKIQVTQAKILEWYRHYGGKVSVSFSGGKDSTVALDLARRAFPDIPAVFVDTGLEYPEIREFVKSVPNVTWLRPELPFTKVIEQYGYPVISKDVAKRIYYARRGSEWAIRHMNGFNSDGTPSWFCQRYMKWRFLLEAPFLISDHCCDVMKKRPFRRYAKETGNMPIIATMTCESKRREGAYLKTGCNAFEKKPPSSQPMSFWTEQEHIRRADKAADKADAAQAKVPKKKKLVKQQDVNPATSKVKTRLRFEDVDKPAPASKLTHTVKVAPLNAASAQAHRKIQEAEQENVGVESAHRLKETAKGGIRLAAHSRRAQKLKPYREAEKARMRLGKANVNALYQKHIQDNPQLASNPISRWQQKRAIRKQYAASVKSGQSIASTMENTARAAKQAAEKSRATGNFIWKHKKGFAVAIALFLAVSVFLNGLSSCSVLVEGVLSGLGSSTYPSADGDMLGAETAYSGTEVALKHELDNYATLHPGHDEYQFDLDEIGHDPYVLISLLTAYHWGGWTLEDVRPTLEMLFERQYTLTETVARETRYDDHDQPYEYTTCKVKLVNFDLSHLPVYVLDENGMHLYASYMATLGNRPDLVPTTEYPNASKKEDYLDYDVPPEALEDKVFAAMLKEAEKYLGFPYVWGGTSPSTSFDCSGFVSWVINHSGWNYGRLGVMGLENVCTPVSRTNAKPGDLVFFIGTYDVPYPDRPSHVGIYVGNGMMIHCGSPISYANINTPYWQNHFYGFGRLREP